MTTMTISQPEAPATEHQVQYLKDLVNGVWLKDSTLPLVKHVRFAVATGSVRKGQASTWLSELIEAKNMVKTMTYSTSYGGGHAASVQSSGGSTQTYGSASVGISTTPVPEFGYYEVGDMLYCWNEFKQAHKKVTKLMKLISVQTYSYKTGQYETKGKWIYAGYTNSAKSKLAGATKMTLEDAIAKGKTVGFCIVCGKTLTKTESVEAGIGPICAKKF